MTGAQFKEGRLTAGMTQVEAAARLGLSQPYLSQLEQGQRPVTADLATSATAVYCLPATALPMPDVALASAAANPAKLARQLAGLGYPSFSHLLADKANPAAVVMEALLQRDLEVRLAEALPWVLLTYPDLDWAWLIRHAKLEDMQNRLGFVVSMAKQLASLETQCQVAYQKLSMIELQLERARLVREDTLCRESMPEAERRWLKKNRSMAARHWNLLTGLSVEDLSYAG